MINIQQIARLLVVMCIALSAFVATTTIAMEIKANQWQLISFPRLPVDATVESVFGDAAENGKLTSIWTFNNNTKEWQSWPAQAGLATSNLTEFTLGQGYWVKTTANINLDLSDATEAAGEMVLHSGWNLIGLSIDQAMGHEQAMAGVPFLELWKYDSNQNKFLAVQKSHGSQIILKEEFSDIEPGTGLWVFMAEQSSLLPSLGTLLPADVDIEPLLNIAEYGVATDWNNQTPGDVDWNQNGFFDFPNTQDVVAFGDFLNRQRISISNEGNGVLSWKAKISDSADWLSFELTDENGKTSYTKTLTGSASNLNSAITLFASRLGKASGSSNLGKITITANGEISEKTIDVSMEVADIIGDYEVNVDFDTIDGKYADLHNPQYFLSLARDGDGIKAFLDEERSLLIPSTTYLSGSYAGDPASNFQIVGQITQGANDELNPFGKPIRRQITYVGRRSDGRDGLSPLDLKGEYYENIYGVFEEPIQLKGSFVANRLSPIPVKKDEVTNSIKGLDIEAAKQDPEAYELEVDLDIDQRLSITQAIAKIKIQHSIPEALTLNLVAPTQKAGVNPTVIKLHANQSRSVQNLSFDDADYSIDGMNILNGQKSFGTWKLQINNTSTNVGKLEEFNLIVDGARVYQISGTVDPGIRLKITGCGITKITNADETGRFVFDGLIPCDYEISIAELGYETTSTRISLLGCDSNQACDQLDDYKINLDDDQYVDKLAELAPKFIASSDSMSVVVTPVSSKLSNDPENPLTIKAIDVSDYSAMNKDLQDRTWSLYKQVSTTTEINDDGYLVDVNKQPSEIEYGKNYISYSENYSKWTHNSRVALSPSTSIDPRGGYNAVTATVIEQGYPSIFQSHSMGEGGMQVKTGDVVAFSAFLKAGTSNEIRFRFASEKGFYSDKTINFETGEHTNNGGRKNPSKIQALANGWYRAQVSVEITQDFNNFYVELDLAKDGNTGDAPVETSVSIFGPQAEIVRANGRVHYLIKNEVNNSLNPESWEHNGIGSITNVIEDNPTNQRTVGLIEKASGGLFLISIQDTINVSKNDKVYVSIIAKNVNDNLAIEGFFPTSEGGRKTTVNIDTGEIISTLSPTPKIRFEKISNEFSLIQWEYTAQESTPSMKPRLVLFNSLNENAPTGSKAYVQAAFFGKANDWPAKYTPPKTLSEVTASDYIPTGANHTERSASASQVILIDQKTTTTPSWAYELGNGAGNAGVYYLTLDSAVKNTSNVSETLSYTTPDLIYSYSNLNAVHFGSISNHGSGGSTLMKAMDSATFDINRPSTPDINLLKDSNHFSGEINPATETNAVGDISDTQINEPSGNLDNHYRIYITAGQVIQTGSMYGETGRMDVGIQTQEITNEK